MRSKDQLRDYQSRTATVLYESDGIELVMPMGSGKTASALTAIAELIHDKEMRHALILAPKRVANIVWPDEIAEWAHLAGLRYEVLNGTPPRRRELLESAPGRDLTIIGVEHTQWVCDELAQFPKTHPLFDILVIDEISRFKNPKSKRAKALLKYARRFKLIWGLTGTPRPNGEEDLFKPLQIVSRSQIWGGSYWRWKQQRFEAKDFMGYDWHIRPEWIEQTAREAAQWMLTLAPEDMPALPPVNIIEHRVRLPAAVQAVYDKMERELFAEIDGRVILADSQGIAMGKCAQVAQGFLYGDDNEDVERLHGEKLIWMEEIAADAAGSPLLVIYEFREDLRQLQAIFGADLPYLGHGVSDAAARKHVEAWNRRELPLMALHAASGGHGLNLQHGGSQMAWFGLTWSAEFFDQTVARIARPGQKERVFIHLCIAESTVDELKRLRVIDKMEAQTAFTTYRLSKI